MMNLGATDLGQAIRLPADDLLTHGVILGRTGSGKSGLTVALLEEVAKSGASAIILDPKGDLTNLALSLSTEPEFDKWVDFADEERLKHGEGLAQSGLGFRDVEEWRDHVDVKIYAPGKLSGGGYRVNLFPNLDLPDRADLVSTERASQTVTAILAAIDATDDPYDPAVVYLTKAVVHQWSQGQGLPVSEWPGILTNPPEFLQNFGGMKLGDFYPKSQRTKLARKLIGFHHHADRWLRGERLNLKSLTRSTKPQLAVFTMRHLTEDDRQFVAGLLLNKVVDFMFETDASEKLKLLVVLDEARGYLPPHPHNPPTKAPICTILAQGRAQGIGMVVGTQNPMDLDYKALSNVGTWFVGRLRERDCARDLSNELSSRGVEIEQVVDMPQRHFLLLDKRGKHQQFRTRWCLNFLFGPLSGEQLLKLCPEEPKTKFFRPKRVKLQARSKIECKVAPKPTLTEPGSSRKRARPARPRPVPTRRTRGLSFPSKLVRAIWEVVVCVCVLTGWVLFVIAVLAMALSRSV